MITLPPVKTHGHLQVWREDCLQCHWAFVIPVPPHLPNWECGSRGGFRLRRNRKPPGSFGWQVITALVEALLPAAASRGHQGRASAFPAVDMAQWANPCLSYCCSSWQDESSKEEQSLLFFPQETLSFNSWIPGSFSSFSVGERRLQ